MYCALSVLSVHYALVNIQSGEAFRSGRNQDMLELIFDAYSLGTVLDEHTALIPQDTGTEEFGRTALTSLDMTRVSK